MRTKDIPTGAAAEPTVNGALAEASAAKAANLDAQVELAHMRRATPAQAAPQAETPAEEACGGRDYCGRFPFCGCGGPDPLPERDATKASAQQGVYRKFEVRRTDGSDGPGGKHAGCEYFVLDVTHDQHAKAALTAYAAACRRTHPALADDLWARHDLGAAAGPLAAPQAPAQAAPQAETPDPAKWFKPAPTAGNWPEDFAHENGCYECRCADCGQHFYGHKRRVVCKACAAPQAPAQAAPQAETTEAKLLEGWKLNHVQFERGSGKAEIGYLDAEDDRFSPIVTVDTGLYYRPDDALPLARAILSALIERAPQAPAGVAPTLTDERAMAGELLRLADILRDCGRLVSTSGTAEASLRQAAATLAATCAEPPIAWVPVHPRNGPLWAMATDKPDPERLPSYPLMPVYGRAEPAGGRDERAAKHWAETSFEWEDRARNLAGALREMLAACPVASDERWSGDLVGYLRTAPQADGEIVSPADLDLRVLNRVAREQRDGLQSLRRVRNALNEVAFRLAAPPFQQPQEKP